MGLDEVPLSVSLLGFGMRTMLANFHMCGIMLLLRAVLNKLVRNASPSGPMCFRCLIFSLSGPELWCVVSVMLYPCMFVGFAICLGVVVILLLNVMAVFSVGGGDLLDRPCMVFQIMCMLCL